MQLEEIKTKIRIKGYLNNITEDTNEEFEVLGIRNKNKISYIIDNTKYNIKIIDNNKLLFIRENNEIRHSLLFIPNQNIISNYLVKENMLDLEIEVKVISLIINDKEINIKYLIPDSNNLFEYKIEMSENL